MGRQRKPTHLKLVEGARDRRPGKVKSTEPVPRGRLDFVDAPSHFDEERKAIWDYAIEHAPLGLLRRLDAQIFEAWCDACHLRREAMRKLKSGSMLVKTPNGAAVQNPYLGIVNRQAVIMKALAAEMGFTPAARTRISVEEGDGGDDPTDCFFA